MEPWKRCISGHEPRAKNRASMGPRRWSRGRVVSLRWGFWCLWCFNGATAMEPWKRKMAQDKADREKALQWGHGDGAVEEATLIGIPSVIPGRFNGATAMEPWKRPT